LTELHKNHRERLRKRYETSGLDDFEDHMILELLLFDAIPRVDTNPIGHRLLDRFGTLDGVFSASEEELCEVKGIGKASARMLKNVKDHMLFRILGECEFSAEDGRLSLGAEYHMRHMPVDSVSVLTRDRVFDYEAEGESDDPCGLSDMIRADLREYGIGERDYAVAVRTDGKGIPSVLSAELEKGDFSVIIETGSPRK